MSLDAARLVPVYRTYFNKLPWIHCHPYCWPETDIAPHRRTEPSVVLHFYANVGLAVTYLCFVAYRTRQAFCDPNPKLEQQLYLALMTSLYAFVVLCFYLPLCQPNEFIQFQRSHIKFISSGKVLLYSPEKIPNHGLTDCQCFSEPPTYHIKRSTQIAFQDYRELCLLWGLMVCLWNGDVQHYTTDVTRASVIGPA